MSSILDAFKLNGQVALVTGGGSGLGWAIAEAMAEAGADVVCVDVDEARADRAAEMVQGLGRRALSIKADVCAETEVKAMIERTVAELGWLDIVFANAGILIECGPFWEEPLETWQRVIDVNLTGVFLTVREAARVMMPQKRGKIIITTSVFGLIGHRKGYHLAYTASKGGIVNLVRTLAAGLAPYGIQVNAFAPGPFKTGIGRGRFVKKDLDEEEKRSIAHYLHRIPLGRLGEPAEIKGLALFLASAASDYVTGATIPIDGGYLAW